MTDINHPRRSQGRRHQLSTVPRIAAGAVLCGMRSYQAIFDWADSLSPKSREHFR
ncbi:MAG: transposase family protein [Methylococcales symbiont of Hymedesmia sp. n. MRB-2018]|nr:MAG: transposase family protein [Methylococcales symbiont of Hymedesmia sp. n. MRB-2018]KAF3982966.1 MAG: transposase family protein [Methylococcales symbiont of Hymedesmia sp. n. MRB-2018]